MTNVRISRQGRWLRGFEISGHSGYAERGEDIVCAAISAISQTAVLGITEVVRLKPFCKQDDAEGRLRVRLRSSDVGNRRAEAILRTMVVGLMNIQAQYPDFLRITFLKRR